MIFCFSIPTISANEISEEENKLPFNLFENNNNDYIYNSTENEYEKSYNIWNYPYRIEEMSVNEAIDNGATHNFDNFKKEN